MNLSFAINSARYLCLALRRRGSQFSRTQCLALRDDERMRAARSVGSESSRLVGNDGLTSRCTCELAIAPLFTMPQSAGCLRSPSVMRHPPVDTFEQVAELCRRDCHHYIGG